MIATKYLHLIALGVVIGGWGASTKLGADIALDGVPSAHHTTSPVSSADAADSSPDTDTPATPVTSHRKKHKSTASTTTSTNEAAAPTGKAAEASAVPAANETGPSAVAKTTKKKRHSKTAPASGSDAEMTGEKSTTGPAVVTAKPVVTRTPAAVPPATKPSAASAPAAVVPTAPGTPVPKTALVKTGRKKKHGRNAAGNDPTALSSPATPPAMGKPVPGGTIAPSTAPLPTQPSPVAPFSTTPPVALGPTVQTGLPVARPGAGTTATLPMGLVVVPGHPSRPGATSTSSYSPPMTKFPFTDYPLPATRPETRSYPWKTDIITTVFWIGEGGSPLSATTNYAGAWNMEWMHDNGGSDDPDDQDGYAQRGHASTLNPFYVALPFNDLVYPDKARRWIPASWFKPSHGGKPVSACQNRWVEIKNWAGRTCFAQWEDVGPLRYDHAEYVFGPERPDTLTHAGLDVSPAVARYLGIDKHGSARTSWKFVDDGDVQPGMWLKYDEQAILYRALIDQERRGTTPPIQDMEQPTPDDQSQDSNRKKAGAARG